VKEKLINISKNIFKIHFIMLIVIIGSVCVLEINGWTAKDYYIDREKAQITIDNGYNGSYTKELVNKLNLLVNKKFYPINISYNFLTLSILAILLIFLLRIKNYKNFLSLPAVSNKLIIFLWINLSYILFAYLFLEKFMSDLEIEVLPGVADSMGIPLFIMIGTLTTIAIPYYLITNTIFFITYRKTRGLKTDLSQLLLFYKPLFSWKYSIIVIFNILSIFLCIMILLYWVWGKFYFLFPVQVIFSLIWLYINISALSVLTGKFISNSEKYNSKINQT